MNIEIKLTKVASRTLSGTQAQMAHIVKRIHAAGRAGMGWSAKASKPVRTERGYEAVVTLGHPKSGKLIEAEAQEIITRILKPAGSAGGWNIKKDLPKEAEEIIEAFDIEAGEIFEGIKADLESARRVVVPEDWSEYFGHIYSREAQINVIMSSIRAFIDSDSVNRFHSIMYGPPGCGKTTIARAIQSMLGSEHVLEYDATATSQAGAIADLSKRNKPLVLIIEEIEKTDDSSLRWLLAALDQRGELRKVNFRTNIHHELKVLCLATVNDMRLFKTVMSGTLYSRFPHKVYCPKPDEVILRRILEREIDKVGGDPMWITPAIKYATEHKIADPRLVTAICLCGRDQLIDNSYQVILDSVRGPEEE